MRGFVLACPASRRGSSPLSRDYLGCARTLMRREKQSFKIFSVFAPGALWARRASTGSEAAGNSLMLRCSRPAVQVLSSVAFAQRCQAGTLTFAHRRFSVILCAPCGEQVLDRYCPMHTCRAHCIACHQSSPVSLSPIRRAPANPRARSQSPASCATIRS